MIDIADVLIGIPKLFTDETILFSAGLAEMERVLYADPNKLSIWAKSGYTFGGKNRHGSLGRP